MTANVTERLNGSPEHLLVVRIRVLMTVAIGLLGALGALRRLWWGRLEVVFGLLTVAPFLLVLVQTYGGEMILRSYFFALVAMAFLAATLFYPDPDAGKSWVTVAAIGAVTLLLGGGFLLARFGNERMDYYTDNEVAAVEALYDMAEPGSLLVVGTDNVPWKAKAVESYKYQIATPAAQKADLAVFLELMTNRRHKDAYLLISRAQKAHAELFLGDAPNAWDRTEQILADSPYFHVVYANPDATIFAVTDRQAYLGHCHQVNSEQCSVSSGPSGRRTEN